MSELVISAGGRIAVDTASLHQVSDDLFRVHEELRAVEDRLRSAAAYLDAAGPDGAFAQLELSLFRAGVQDAVTEAGGVAAAAAGAAELYETVELLVERELAAAGGDRDEVARLEGMLRERAAEDPGTVEAARALLGVPAGDTLLLQTLLPALLLGSAVTVALALLAARSGVGVLGRGTPAAHERLREGEATAVTAAPVRVVATTAPTTFAEAAARIPAGDAERIRVERYVLADGRPQFAVYVAGTHDGDDTAFDLRSNVELYGGVRSASYAAVEQALEAAGARPGDTVHAFGHSQGAMVLERLALEGTYDTRTLVSFGSPVQAEVGADTLAVTVRHADDPVVALQSGGQPLPVGSAGSFVVERVVDPLPSTDDLQLGAHQMATYAQTAALVDASSDPRVEGLRALFAELSAADRADAVELTAERVSPSGADAG